MQPSGQIRRRSRLGAARPAARLAGCRMKLANKFALATILGIAGVLAITTFAHSQREIARWEKDDRRDREEIAEFAATTVLTVWERAGQEDAGAALEAARRGIDARLRWVWLDEGIPPEALGDEPAIDRDTLDIDGPGQTAYVFGPDDELMFTYRSALAPGDRLGAVEVAAPPGERGERIRALVWQGVGLTVIIAVVAGLVAVALGKRLVGRPIDELAAVARRVGQGDFSGRVHIRQDDELGDLGRELNTMCATLEEVEHRRESAREQLRYADRLATVGQIASSIAHEVGTPLNIVSGRASMMASGLVKHEDVAKNADIIVEQTRRMAGIIRHLLDYARRGAGAADSVDVRALIVEAFQLLQPSARKRNVELALADHDSDEPASVHGDAAQLQQVLANVIVNGIEAMPTGGHLEVRTAWTDATAPPDYDGHSGRFLRIDVRDEGRGIPEAHRPHIFDAFYTTKGPGEGTGLGLAVADEIVRAHRGWIAVESREGEGTRLSVYLPHGDAT